MSFMDGYHRDEKVTAQLITTISAGLRLNPDQRLGQLLCNALGWQSATLFNVYDERVIQALETYVPDVADLTVTTTEATLQRAIELLDQFDRGTRVEDSEYPGSPFATSVTEFLEEQGKR